MKRGSEEIKDETSPASLTKRLSCRKISTADNINIPLDLTVEILKKLPTKSLLRFQCVSKQWSSTIGSRRDFIDSIVARSLTEPRRDTHLIFLHCSDKILKSDFFTFCSTYPSNTDNGSVSILSDLCQYVRGLFIFWSYDDPEVAIYNPTTRQSLSLPKINFPAGIPFLGYDPFKNQYKVIFLRKNIVRSCHVFTLGDPTRKWREIQCDIGLHFPFVAPVCINGTIYYRATIPNGGSRYVYVLMSFDVMSEKFDQVETPKTLMDHWSTLINYRGKLGFICLQKGVEIWVMEDARKEWSKIIFYEMEGLEKWDIAGATRDGEIVFVNRLLMTWHQTLYVYYYDPKRNSLRCVEVEGTKIGDTDYYGRKHYFIYGLFQIMSRIRCVYSLQHITPDCFCLIFIFRIDIGGISITYKSYLPSP